MENNLINNIRKKNKLIILVIVILILSLTGTTLAYFFSSDSDSSITGDLGDVKLSMTVTKVLPNTNKVDDIILIGFNELASSINSDCVYDEYTLCQIYKINLVNGADSINTDVKGSLSFSNENTPNLSWVYLGQTFNTNTNYTSAMLGNKFNVASATPTNFINSYLLERGTDANFYVVLWVNEINDVQYDEGIFNGTVRFEDSNGNGVTANFSD